MGVESHQLRALVESAGFVITPDIALKMHIINERRKVSANLILQVRVWHGIAASIFADVPVLVNISMH